MSEYRDKAKTVRSSARSLLSAYRKERAMKRGRKSAASAPAPDGLDADVAVLEPAEALQASSAAAELASQAAAITTSEPLEASEEAPVLSDPVCEDCEDVAGEETTAELDAPSAAAEPEAALNEDAADVCDAAEAEGADAAFDAEPAAEPEETAEEAMQLDEATEEDAAALDEGDETGVGEPASETETETEDEPVEAVADGSADLEAAEEADGAPDETPAPCDEAAELEAADAPAEAQADETEPSAPPSKSQARLEVGVATPVDPLFGADDVASDESELARLPGIGPGLIWALQRAGVANLADLAAADADALSTRLGVIGDLINVQTWIEEARSAVEKDADAAAEGA